TSSGSIAGDCEKGYNLSNGNHSCNITIPSTQVSTTLTIRMLALDIADNWGTSGDAVGVISVINNG
ncbi:MAG: hypothetical protein VXA26_10360, partial [Candidatus Neomarinimicrobiota bacterium]